MGQVVEIGKNGEILYIGMLSSQEIAAIDDVITTLKSEIPVIEAELAEKYGKGVLYKYYLGHILGDLLARFKITYSERVRFWKEIKYLASNETRKRDEGKNSSRRCFYEQCYVLSQQPINIVERLTWRQWQDLLDRDSNREDERIFLWIGSTQYKIREAEWREFEKGLHLFLKSKDTSVFTNDELFEIYDSIYAMGSYWLRAFAQFSKDNPKSAKIKTKARRCKKYQETCFKIKKELKKPLDETIFEKSFEQAMA